MTSGFTVITRAPVAPETLFDVSLDIDQHVASMAHTDESAVAGTTSGRIGLGESVTWRARHVGILVTMTSRITALERPHGFVDEQTRGPFRSFRHEHRFLSDGTGTVMIDVVTLSSPIGGILAERLVLVPYLRRLIARRNRHLLATVGVATSSRSAAVRRGFAVASRSRSST